jgi:hypothetical protein
MILSSDAVFWIRNAVHREWLLKELPFEIKRLLLDYCCETCVMTLLTSAAWDIS